MSELLLLKVLLQRASPLECRQVSRAIPSLASHYTSRINLLILRLDWELPAVDGVDTLDRVCGDFVASAYGNALRAATSGNVTLFRVYAVTGNINIRKCFEIACKHSRADIVEYMLSEYGIGDKAMKAVIYATMNGAGTETEKVTVLGLIETKYVIWKCFRSQLTRIARERGWTLIEDYLSN